VVLIRKVPVKSGRNKSRRVVGIKLVNGDLFTSEPVPG